MVAIVIDIEVEQYATFELPILCVEADPTGETEQLVPRDLTGWVGAMQIRDSADTGTVLAEADVEIDTDTGLVTAVIDDTVTAGYTWRAGVYDLIITDGVTTDRLARGAARCTRGVTR